MGNPSNMDSGLPSEDDQASDDDEFEMEEDKEECPIIPISKVEKTSYRRHWRQTDNKTDGTKYRI